MAMPSRSVSRAVKWTSAVAITALALSNIHAEEEWTTNGVHNGILTLSTPPGSLAGLDWTNTVGGRDFMGTFTLVYALWTLEGEPAHDFVFTWDWRPGDKTIGDEIGGSISTKQLGQFPDLMTAFLALKPVSVTLDTVIEFFAKNGQRLGVGRKRISLGSLEQAGARTMLHLPGSPRWADFFSCDYADTPSREEQDRRNKELFQKAARVKLSSPKLVAISWPDSALKSLALRFRQRTNPAQLAPRRLPQPDQSPGLNPLEQSFQEAYSGRFSTQEMDLRLASDGQEWQGALQFKGKSYVVKAQARAGKLAGVFADGTQSWPFTAAAEGNQLIFTAGSFSAAMERNYLADLSGRWGGPEVQVDFQPPATRPDSAHAATRSASGRIQMNGQKFSFSAQEHVGELAGTARTPDTSFTFKLTWAVGGLSFKADAKSLILAQIPNRSWLKVITGSPYQYKLFNEGKAVTGVNDRFEFDGDRELRLELQARGCYPLRTNLWLPGYSEITWETHLQQRIYPDRETARWTNSLDMVFVRVPASKVLVSCLDTRVSDYAAYAEANAGTDSSWRKAEFQGCAVGRKPDEPVVMVSCQDARSFCRWLTERERENEVLGPNQSYRLPTDAEWSLAAGLESEKGVFPKDKDMKIKAVFPWGNQWPPPAGSGNFADRAAAVQFKDFTSIETYDDGFATTSPVGHFEANRFGLYDLAGNVWQWCEDWFDSRQDKHVLRGGSWRSYEPRVLWSSHRATAPDVRDPSIGFRCVLVVEPATTQ